MRRDPSGMSAGEAVRVPLAVVALVVGTYPRHLLVDEGPVHDALAQNRVLADEGPLGRGGRPGLEEDAVRDADLPDVVQQRRLVQEGGALRGPATLEGQGLGKGCHPL